MDTSLTADAVTRLRSIRALALGGALIAASLVAPAATVAEETTFRAPTANERAIALTESEEAPVFAPLTQNQRSILAIESKEAPVAAAFQPPTANERSIALTESKEPSSSSAFVPLTQNERSIALIESKEAPGGVLVGGVPDAVPSGNR